MKKLERVMALLLAVITVIYGIPLQGASAEPTAQTGGDPEQPYIRLVQHKGEGQDDGFDESTGILTMDLEVRPSVQGQIHQGAVGQDKYTGLFIDSGYLAFRVDTSSVRPITATNHVVFPDSGELAYVGDVPSINTDSGRLKDLFKNSERLDHVGSKDFRSDFGLKGDEGLNSFFSGMLVSSERSSPVSSNADDGMLDCYVQFGTNMTGCLTDYNEDGYVKVMSLRFQCYSGYDENGKETVATDEKVLFSKSFWLPEGVGSDLDVNTISDPDDAQKLVNQFYINDKTTYNDTLAMGVAGVREKKLIHINDPFVGSTYVNYGVNSYYYYGIEPISTGWYDYEWGSDTGENAPQSCEGRPGLTYANMDKKYTVDGFSIDTTNTYNTDEPAPDDPDFVTISTESSSLPRYRVPTTEDVQRLEETVTAMGSWVPERYSDNPLEQRQVMLKYAMGTSVSVNSELRPENDEGGIKAFLGKVSWVFTLKDGTRLDSFNCEITGEPQRITLSAGTEREDTYDVYPAVISDDRCVYNGKKVQIAESTTTGERTVTPVGVLLDFNDNTKISYSSTMGETVEETGLAPQLRITSDAADIDSYVWETKNNDDKSIYLAAIYKDVSGGEFAAFPPIKMKIYKESSVPMEIDMKTEELLEVESAGSTVPGFSVPVGGDVENDKLIVEGLKMNFSLRDQYGFTVVTNEGGTIKPTVTVVPSNETATELKKKKGNPFIMKDNGVASNISEAGWYEYALKYGEDKGANDVAAGKYTVKAESNNVVWEKELTVVKDSDYFAYMESTSSINYTEDSNGVRTVNVTVPALGENDGIVTKEAGVRLVELANQWRIPSDDWQIPSEYDLVQGLRDKNGEIVLTNVRNSFDVDFTYTDANGDQAAILGLDTTGISNGSFKYNSQTKDNTVMYLTVKVHYKNDPEVKVMEQKYKFVFKRDAPYLKRIVITNATEVGKGITVPSLAEEQAGGKRSVTVLAQARDQYGEYVNWGNVYQSNPTVAGTWMVKTSTDIGSQTGITVGGEFNHVITVDYTAQPVETQLWVQYGGTQSQKISFGVYKPISKPARASSLSYSKKTLTVPDLSELSSTDSATPSITVVNQFNEVMEQGTEYFVKWEFETAPADKEKILIDENTGKVTVKALAAEEKAINILAKVYDKNRTWQWTVTYRSLSVKRSEARVADIEIQPLYPDAEPDSQFTIAYPDLSGSDTSRRFQFSVAGTTQYGEGEELQSNAVKWILDEITLQNGTILKRGEGMNGDIYLDGGVYVDKKNTLTLETTGRLTLFSQQAKNDAPKSIKIRCQANTLDSELNFIEDTRDITVSIGKSRGHEITIADSVSEENISVPDLGKSNMRTLSAVVKDQFGFIIGDAPSKIQWSIKEGDVKGVSLSGNVITVDHTAQDGAITVQASYTEADQAPIVDEVEVGVSRKIGTPDRVEIVGIKIDGVSKDNLVAPLPGLKGNDYTSYQDATYQLLAKVYDNFGVQMSGVGLKWTITSDTYGLVKSVTSNTGRIVVAANENWLRNSNVDTDITVELGLSAYPGVTKDIKILSLKKEKDTPAYAIPEKGSFDASDRTGYENYLLVPKKGDPSSAAEFSAKVYSQYGTVMPDEKAKFTLVNAGAGMKTEEDADAGTLKLSVSSTTSALYAEVRAVPENNPQGVNDNSITRLFFDLGVSYIAGPSLGSGPDSPNDNKTSGDVGAWKVDVDAHVPVVDTENKDTYTFNAFVADQRGAEYINTTNYYPVWQFAEDYKGVKFVENTDFDGEGNAKGKSVTIEVTNEALGQNELQKTIYLDCWVVGQKNIGEESVVHQAFTLKKAASVPTFMYFEDINEEGISTAPLQRPTVAEGSLSQKFQAVVYDQYGYAQQENVSLALSSAAIEAQGASLEPVYQEGLTPEEQEAAQPLYWRITQNEELVGEFFPITGVVTLYTKCTLTELELFARCSKIPGLVKTLNIPIVCPEKKASVLMLEMENKGDIVLEDVSQEAAQLAQSTYAVVFDQFNENFPGPAAFPVWSLLMRDEDGNYVKYEEYDEFGYVTNENQWLVNIKAGGSRNVVLTVYPSRFDKPVWLRLSCQLHYGSANGEPLSVEAVYADFQIRKSNKSSSGGNTELQGPFMVTYDAGAHGRLADTVQELVIAGGKPKLNPGIKTNKGYAFTGWMTDFGDFAEKATDLEIWNDTVATAQYRDISKFTFLHGYDDGSVRPNNAVTRGEFVKMLVIAINNYDPDKNYSHPFMDVNPARYYENYIGYAFGLGIVEGDEKGNFRPDDPVTRAEAVKMVAKAAQLEPGSGIAVFHDVKANSWYAGYVEALVEAGILHGYEDGTFRPGNTISRGEAVKLLVLIMKDAPTDEELERIRRYNDAPFSDVHKNQWYYPYILRASGTA